jgi:hypothetical protein
LPLLPAARKRSAPQLYIKGVTPQPKALLQEKEEGGRTWEAVVLIRKGQPPTVAPVPPPHDPHPRSVWLSKGKNTEHATLTGAIYKRIIKDTLLGPGNERDGTLHPPRHPINLLHDRDPAHRSKEFLAFAKRYNINAELLPARSPDLDPLDYGVFGPAQRSLDRELERRTMTFEQQCAYLEGHIKQANTDAAIAALPSRIARCIAARGWHFE